MGQESNDIACDRCEVARERRQGLVGFLQEVEPFRKQPTLGQGDRREENQGPMRAGGCLHRHPGETDSNPTLYAFPPQGEKGAAGSPGLLGLLGQKVGIDEL